MGFYKAHADPKCQSTVLTLDLSIEDRAMMTDVADLHDVLLQDCSAFNRLGHLFIHGRVSGCECPPSQI